mgnify:CR=1 FL=1
MARRSRSSRRRGPGKPVKPTFSRTFSYDDLLTAGRRRRYRRPLVKPERIVPRTARLSRNYGALLARERQRQRGYTSLVRRQPARYTIRFPNMIPRPIRRFVCSRRKRRRETLFALQRTGAGARSTRRRTPASNIRCP